MKGGRRLRRQGGQLAQLFRWILTDDHRTARTIRLALALTCALMIIFASIAIAEYALGTGSMSGALALGVIAALRPRRDGPR
jgi:hypothetical protein